ncbi:10fbf7e4-1b53-4d21-9f03-19a2449e214f [Thermothielavioides terrestris]|nr:10fbf7e4-1b53-4d21-9f03-19a2449e214f [Thermothielavioides terrestris]
MDSVTEPVRTDDGPPSANSPPSIDTKIEQTGDDVEMTEQTPALLEATETAIVSGQKEKAENSPPNRPASVDPAAPTSADISHPISMNGNRQQHSEIGAANRANSNDDTNEDTQDTQADSHESAANEDTTEDLNEELTPPPDSPVEEPMSRTPSVPPNALQDEIVVGTKAHGKTSPTQAAEPEDVVMGEAEDKPLAIHHAKRKRASGVYAESAADKDPSPAPSEELDPRRPVRPIKAHGTGGVKGVLLGFWRDSPPENDAEKHAVIGFIDVRDRLRTRILPSTRDGRPMDPRYPIPPGPGGSWVTFDKVAFDDHLVGLNHHVIKEYVKIRAEESHKGETPEEDHKLALEAAELAAERVRRNPPPDAATAPLVAFGAEIPANAMLPNRPETKKRRLAGSFGAPSDSPSTSPLTLDHIHSTRPTRVLLGYWKHSSEKDPKDKHAVFGILGANDMFRVKLTRETRDGRTVIGNFPSGAGALWIHWDEVEFDPHLSHLSRAEVKEYCRIRQRQLDYGELPQDRVANETKAVYEAQQRVAQSLAMGVSFRKDDLDLPPIAMKGSPAANGSPRSSSFAASKATEESRPAPMPSNQGSPPRPASGRHPLPNIEFRAANRHPAGPSPAVLERTNSLARREIARLEAAQARADLRAASREASLAPAGNPSSSSGATGSARRPHNNDNANATSSSNSGSSGHDVSHFQDNVSRLNKIWEAQEAQRIRAGVEDAKIYGGVKYQRKQSGPFQGKLVSQGTIITIDGEDYVEYRVLTKPTFF